MGSSDDNISLAMVHDQLYYNVLIAKDYENSAMISLILEDNDKGQLIADVVDRLLHNGTQNIMEYAYKLWHYGGKGIVMRYFPEQFQYILNGDIVKFQNERDGLPVKLAVQTDGYGDRGAWGDASDKSIHRLTWKIISIWEGNRLYFKFLNLDRTQYLKLEVAQDSVGDHRAYGSDDSDTDRHQWYLRPVKYKNSLLFYIYNRKYNQPLILGRWSDFYRDRMLWGSHEDVNNNPEHFGWHIDAVKS